MKDEDQKVYEHHEMIVYPMSAYERNIWRGYLIQIHSPWKRLLVELVIRFFIVTGPIFNDQVTRDFAAAHDMKITAMRTRDFISTITAPKRYRQMHYRAMLITRKQTIRLYSVAFGRVLKNVIAEVLH